MDKFRENYTVYYNVLCITGLWPYDNTLLAKVQRVGYALLTLYCIVIQVSTLKFVDASLYNLLQLLSFTFPMLLFFLRYVGFVFNFPVFREVFDNIENDCATMNNPIEAKMIINQIIEAKRVILALLGLSCAGICLAILVLLVPAILQSSYQIHFLNILGFFYAERSREINLVSCHVFVVTSFGLLTITCTESSLAVFSSYLCGLFEIASYRIETIINTMARSENQNGLIDIRSAVKLHQRAIQVTLNLTESNMVSYLVAIIAVVISFAVNLYRFYLAVLEMEKLDRFIVSLQIFLVHVLVMFLNNYSGQRLISTSVELKDYCIVMVHLGRSSRLYFVLVISEIYADFNSQGNVFRVASTSQLGIIYGRKSSRNTIIHIWLGGHNSSHLRSTNSRGVVDGNGRGKQSILHNICHRSVVEQYSRYSVHTHDIIDTEMDSFKRNYNTYYNVLNFTGLWPYNHSLVARVQRVVFVVVTLCCIVIQVTGIRPTYSLR